MVAFASGSSFSSKTRPETLAVACIRILRSEAVSPAATFTEEARR
jgi:hypothetical protein